MRLVTKLTLSFLVVALVPVGVGSYLFFDRVRDSFEASFVERTQSIAAATELRLKAISSEIDRALTRIAADTVVQGDLLEPLSRDQFYSEPESVRKIVKEARRLMSSAVLDTLRFVDLKGPDKHVGFTIALGHRGGAEQDDKELASLLAKNGGSTYFRYERVENEATGKTDEVWTYQVALIASQGKAKVALIGGKIVGRQLVDDLQIVGPTNTQIELVGKDGRRVAATFEGSEPPAVVGGYSKGERQLGDSLDPNVAVLRVFVPRDSLVGQIEELVAQAGILAGAAAGIALLAGLLLARRLSKPLAALATAASEIAAGARREVRVPRGRDEVAKLTIAFNQMTVDLVASEEKLRQSERVAAWREIARRIAHEIKNPLSPIQMSIETLKKVWDRRHPDFETIFQESTATILEEVARMKRIVTEFSDFARMPAPRPHEIELVELVTQIVNLMKDTAPDVECRILADGPVSARVDPDQLRQAVMNLVKNGLEALAAKPGGEKRLEVKVAREGAERVRLTVTDTGPGMSAETKARLFTPYFTTKSQGTGLGLAMVQRIVGEHDGNVRVESDVGVGTRFVVRLPVAGPGVNPRSTNPPV